MDARSFVCALGDENAAFWRDRDVRQDPAADAGTRLAQLRARMRQGVYNELRSVELIAAWLPHVPEREIRDLPPTSWTTSTATTACSASA